MPSMLFSSAVTGVFAACIAARFSAAAFAFGAAAATAHITVDGRLHGAKFSGGSRGLDFFLLLRCCRRCGRLNRFLRLFNRRGLFLGACFKRCFFRRGSHYSRFDGFFANCSDGLFLGGLRLLCGRSRFRRGGRSGLL